MEIARYLHARSAREQSGVVVLHPTKPAEQAEGSVCRIGLHQGLITALDAGENAPVPAQSQLRFLLRKRSRPEFLPNEQLSRRYAVDAFRPDLCIRQHIDAQARPPTPLRQQIGMQRISVILPPHSSALHPEEQAVVRYLTESHTIVELLDQGAQTGAWSPLRALRLLVVLDALHILLIGDVQSPLREAHRLLGLDPGATVEEIKQAYRRLARSLHPDSHPTLAVAAYRELTDRFTALHGAYRLLLRQVSGTD